MPINLMSLLGTGAISKITDSVGSALDNLITSDEERLQAKAEISRIVSDHTHKIIEIQSSLISAEMRGNWLQRSWRPLIMLAFGFIVIYEYFFAKILNLPPSGLPDEFFELLKLGLGGYVIGRSGEKITKSLFPDGLKARNKGK